MRAVVTDSIAARAVARLAIVIALAACSQDNTLTLDVTADEPARRLRVEIKGPVTRASFVEEFDVDPGDTGRDITDPAQAYRIGFKLPAAGRYGVHIVDVTSGAPTQSYGVYLDIDGARREDAHLFRLNAGDDDDGDGWPENCPAGAPAECVADCNDAVPGTNPFAVDICEDGVDQDCTGSDRPCEDKDGDGFDETVDCDDEDAEVNPDVREESTICFGPDPKCDNGKDDDCDGADAVCHTDVDCDGHWPTGETDGDDCDDNDAAVHPGTTEICDDAVDQNCDGDPDDGCERCDEDGDGEYGYHPERGCLVDPGVADCDDADRNVHHAATSDCGGLEGAPACARRGDCALPAVDEDCDGMANEGCPDPSCDADADGFAMAGCGAPGATDCDDLDPHVFPGAPELCGDGIPQNCSIDLPCAGDGDADGWDDSVDCDDANPDAHPWGDEVCDSADNDCDGVIDEGNPGVTVGTTLDGVGCNFDNDGVCNSAGASGRCVCSPTASDGVMDASGDRVFCTGEPPVAGGWGPRCFGAIQPTYERCDLNDWDCDERLDDPLGENLSPDELGQPCHNLPTPCVQGMVIGCDFSQPASAYYTNPYWVCSANEQGPVAESCNGSDDDCDFSIDDGFNLGAGCDGGDADFCNEGVIMCDGAGGTVCGDMTGNNFEYCNGDDDDCDGSTDEGYPNLGVACDGPDSDFCTEGAFVCDGPGTGTVCGDTTGNTVEICNFTDDDCDGTTNEGFPDLGLACDGGDADLCNEGFYVCNGMGTATVCSDVSGTNSEICNGIDDDCDGMTNEGFPNLGMACDGGDSDMCQEGTFVCNGTGSATVCNDSSSNTLEVCGNGLDDDCDGMFDEGFPTLGMACDGADTDLCTEGTIICSGTTTACSDTSGNNTELCNGADDDCDTFVDEGYGNLGMACDGTGDTDVCVEGVYVCNAAQTGTVCNDMTTSTTETCNNMDDDCDLATDESPAFTATCNVLRADNCTAGVCMCGMNPSCPGMQQCVAGSCT